MRQLVFALLAALLLPAAAHAGWREVKSPNFTLYTDVDAGNARRYAETLELFDAVLRDRHGMPLGQPARRPLTIYLLSRSRDLQAASPGLGQNIAGFYSSHDEDTFAIATHDRRDDSTLLHEYVHHFMLAHFPYNYPGWLIEGYAEYFMTMKNQGVTFELGNVNQNRAQWLTYETYLPYDLILKVRPSQLKTSTQMSMYYAQSWALTHYMMSDPKRREQLDAYVRAVGGGADSVAAMTKATGQTSKELGRAIRAYLNRGFPYQRFNRGAREEPALTVTELPDGTGELMLLALRVKADNGEDAPEDKTDGPVLLSDARRMAARFPGLRHAALVQAQAEIKLGDLTAAERLLAGLVAEDANDVAAMHYTALARLKAAESADATRAAALRAEARTLAGKAHKIDPNHYQTLITYSLGREGMPGFPTDNDLEVLRDALDLAPQVDSLRFRTAQALAFRDKDEEAIRVLRPMAFDPHGGDSAGAAKALLDELEGPETAAETAEATGE